MVTRRPYKDQLGKVSREAWIAHKLKMQKRRKAGEKDQEEIVERRRIEGTSLKLEVMQKVPEQVVQERMSQGKGVKGLKEKKESTRMVYRRDEGKNMILLWRKALKK